MGDVDQDGHLDLALTWGTGGTRVYFGDGTGTFGQIAVPPHETCGRSMTLSDLDADGLLDLVIAGDGVPDCERGRVSIVHNMTGRAFELVESHEMPLSPVAVESGDLDGDGVQDIVVGMQVSSNIRILRGHRDCTFEDPNFSFGGGAGQTSTRLAIADYNGDARPDVLVPTSDTQDLTLYLNTSPNYPEAPEVCLAGRVNSGRGTLADVLFVNDSSGDSVSRTLGIPIGSPIVIRMEQAPTRALKPSSKYALWAWLSEPDDESLKTLPFGVGCVAFPIPLTGGVPQPKLTWNNLGYYPQLGDPDLPSDPAPSVVLNRDQGVQKQLTFTLQGIIRDDGSLSRKRASVTNGIVVHVE